MDYEWCDGTSLLVCLTWTKDSGSTAIYRTKVSMAIIISQSQLSLLGATATNKVYLPALLVGSFRDKTR